MINILAIAMTSLGLFAAEPLPSQFKVQCVTEFPTTSFFVERNKDKVQVEVRHHNGAQYAPIFNGMVTARDLSLLGEKAKVFQRLGDSYLIEFPTDRCKLYGTKLLSCGGGAPAVLGDVKVDSFSLNTRVVREKVYDLTFDKVQVSLYLQIGSESHQLLMDYYGKDCRW